MIFLVISRRHHLMSLVDSSAHIATGHVVLILERHERMLRSYYISKRTIVRGHEAFALSRDSELSVAF